MKKNIETKQEGKEKANIKSNNTIYYLRIGDIEMQSSSENCSILCSYISELLKQDVIKEYLNGYREDRNKRNIMGLGGFG